MSSRLVGFLIEFAYYTENAEPGALSFGIYPFYRSRIISVSIRKHNRSTGSVAGKLGSEGPAKAKGYIETSTRAASRKRGQGGGGLGGWGFGGLVSSFLFHAPSVASQWPLESFSARATMKPLWHRSIGTSGHANELRTVADRGHPKSKKGRRNNRAIPSNRIAQSIGE
jgi:hypothetical protein